MAILQHILSVIFAIFGCYTIYIGNHHIAGHATILMCGICSVGFFITGCITQK